MFTRRLSWFAAAGLTAAVLAGAGAGTTALADTRTGSTTYQGCINGGNGDLYNVQASSTSAPSCHGNDQSITWNSTGPTGAQGPT